MALPCGFSRNTLPLSMQLIGKAFDEATVFQVGDAYQRLTDWHLQVPPIATKVTSA
jgi:aspartyl-tRNA(Asn)/glutamyl-tRNA(Gln) amidotransferase subunit A